MTTTKHVYTYKPRCLGDGSWDTIMTHDVETYSNPLSGTRIIEIEFRGCSLGDIHVGTDIDVGSFVIFRPKITTEGLPKGVNHGDFMSRCIYYTVLGINNASLVLSDCDTYPANLDDKIPTLEDLRDPKIRHKIEHLDAFLEQNWVTSDKIREAGRTKEYNVW